MCRLRINMRMLVGTFHFRQKTSFHSAGYISSVSILFPPKKRIFRSIFIKATCIIKFVAQFKLIDKIALFP